MQPSPSAVWVWQWVAPALLALGWPSARPAPPWARPARSRRSGVIQAEPTPALYDEQPYSLPPLSESGLSSSLHKASVEIYPPGHSRKGHPQHHGCALRGLEQACMPRLRPGQRACFTFSIQITHCGRDAFRAVTERCSGERNHFYRSSASRALPTRDYRQYGYMVLLGDAGKLQQERACLASPICGCSSARLYMFIDPRDA